MWSILVAQSCLTLRDPMDCSPPSSSVHRILQARILEWVAIPFSRDLWTQGLNLGLLHSRLILYHLSHQGSLQRSNKYSELIIACLFHSYQWFQGYSHLSCCMAEILHNGDGYYACLPNSELGDVMLVF